MVQSKSDRERQKLITDKCQSLIEVLLKDEDNKYCVDCDAKGPRWASWNLGIFLCIRCAGIHRNLGVHISRVKSVNLDAWTPEQVAHVQRMGNSRARAIYEANLPDDFRRPQTDTALESLIRAKYEHKRYIAQDYVDPGPPEPAFNADEEIKRMKEQKRSKLSSGSNKTMISVSDSFSSSLSTPPSSATTASNTSGILGDITKTRSTSTSSSVSSSAISQTPTSLADSSKKPVTTGKSALDDLMDLDFSQKPATTMPAVGSTTNNSHMMMRSLSSAFCNTGSFDNSHFSQAFASLSQHQPPMQQPTLIQQQQQQPHQSPNVASLADFGTSPFSGLESASPMAPPTSNMSTLTPTKPAHPVVASTHTATNPSIFGSASNNDKNVMNLLDL